MIFLWKTTMMKKSDTAYGEKVNSLQGIFERQQAGFKRAFILINKLWKKNFVDAIDSYKICQNTEKCVALYELNLRVQLKII